MNVIKRRVLAAAEENTFHVLLILLRSLDFLLVKIMTKIIEAREKLVRSVYVLLLLINIKFPLEF